MTNSELKAIIFVKLRALGFKVSMNKKISISDHRGYKSLNLDIVIMDKDWPVIAILVGKPKERKKVKYSMSKLSYVIIEEEADIPEKLEEVYKRYSNSLFKIKE